jgi:subtilisin family serine protease
MKTKLLITALSLLNLNVFSQCFVNKVFDNQNLNPSSYDFVSIAVDPSGNILSTSNHLLGSNTKINVRCLNNIGGLSWLQNIASPISQNNYGVDIKTDASGNSYVCGANHNGTNYDYNISKYNSSGLLIWQQIYNGTGNNDDIPSAIEIDNAGNVYVTGTSNGVGLLNTDYVTIKYNSTGLQQWLLRYDNVGLPEIATDILVDSVGDVFVTGASASTINNSDVTTLKYSGSGVLLNTHRHSYAGNGYDLSAEMTFDTSNNILITGTFDNGNKKFGTLKLSNTLIQLWFNSLSGSLLSEGYGIYTDNSSNIISVGYQNNSSGGSDIIINKYTSSGSLSWNKTFQNINPSNFAKARKVKTDASGNIYVVSDAVLTTTKDFLTLVLDANGNLLWEKYYNSPTNSNDVPNAIQLQNNTVIVSGISTLGSSKTISTVKYNVDIKPLVPSSVSSNAYNKNELLIWFDTSHVIKSSIDKKEFQSGRLADFIKPDFLKKLNDKIQLGWDELKTFKVYTNMTTADSVSKTRNNTFIKVPTFWATLSVMLPTYASEQQVKDSLTTFFYDIKEVDFNYLCSKSSVPNDPLVTTNQAGLIPVTSYPNAHINVNQAWDYSVGSSFIKVGVFDDVIYWGHEDFGNGTLAGSKITGGYDYYNSTSIINTTSPVSSHGTACAGIIGGLRNNNLGISGIAGGDFSAGNTGVQLYSMGIFSGENFSTDALVRNAIVEGATSSAFSTFGFGLNVQNHSWGGPNNSFTSAIKFATQNYCTVVVSKGNDGLTNSTKKYPSCSKDDYVIAVGASGTDGKHKNTSNGDYSYTTNWESNYDFDIDIIAPGATEIVSSAMNPSAPFPYPTSLPYSNYTYFNGTSAAAPHVSGVAALMISKHNNGGSPSPATKPENLTPEDVENIMQNTATDIIDGTLGYPVGYDIWNGHGRINAGECLHKVNYPEYEVVHWDIGSGISTSTVTNILMTIPSHITSIGVAAGNYFTDRVEVQAITGVTKNPSQSLVGYWLVNNNCYGTDATNPMSLNTNYQEYVTTPVVFGSSGVSAALKSYCYYIKYDMLGNAINKWFPTDPYHIHFSWAAHLKDNSYVGIEESENITSNISIHPNPTSQTFFIKAGIDYKTGKNDKYEILSINGQLLYSDKITSNSTEIDISSLANGIYIVKAIINNSISINKIVKNN